MNGKTGMFTASFLSAGVLALVAVLQGDLPLGPQTTAPRAVEQVVAIDILLQPDETMRTKARALNARLREGYPAGFELEGQHAPRITLVRTFVRARQLDTLAAAVARIVDDEQLPSLRLKAMGYGVVAGNGPAEVDIVVERTPGLARLHRRVLDAVAPYAVPSGDGSAFAGGATAATVTSVRSFLNTAARENFAPHVMVGIATPALAQQLAAEPFLRFMFDINGVAIYQLGNSGTAAKVLWSWSPQVAVLAH